MTSIYDSLSDSKPSVTATDLRAGDVLLFECRRFEVLKELQAHILPTDQQESDATLDIRACFDAAIASLDDSDWGHAAIVVGRDRAGWTLLVDSIGSVATASLHDRKWSYGGGRVLVLRPKARRTRQGAAIGVAAAAQALAMTHPERKYPLRETVLAAFALKLRRSLDTKGYRERLKVRNQLDDLLSTLRDDDSARRGWMCAGLVGESYRRARAPLRLPARILGTREVPARCRESAGLAALIWEQFPELKDRPRVRDRLAQFLDPNSTEPLPEELLDNLPASGLRTLWWAGTNLAGAVRGRPAKRHTAFLTPGDLTHSPSLDRLGLLEGWPIP